MAVVDELVTILGVKLAADAIGKLKTFKDGVADVSKSVMGLGVVITGVVTAAGLFINKAVNEATELQKLSDKTGLSTTALQEWGYAAEQAGGSAKAIQGDLQMLQQKFMGTGKTAETQLLRMADSFKGLTAAQAQTRGKMFGLSDDTISLLRKGREGVEELRKEAHKLGGVIPPDAIKRAADFKKSLAELQFALRGITSQMALATVPALEKIVKGFKDFIEINREWVSLGLEALFTGIVNGVERFFGVLKQVTGVFQPLIDYIKQFLPEMDGAEFVTHLVTGALTGLLIILSPLLAKLALIGTAVVAVSMIFEDFFTYLEGGDSVIGGLFDAFAERWPELFATIQKVGQWFKDNIGAVLEALIGIIGAVGSAFGEIFGAILDGLNSIAGPISEFFSAFDEKFPALSEMLSAFASLVKTAVIGAFEMLIGVIKTVIDVIFKIAEAIGGVLGKVAAFFNWVAEKLGFGGDANSEMLEKVSAEIDAAQTATASAGAQGAKPATSAGAPQTTQYHDNKQVTIQVATNDPAQAAQQTAQAVQQSNINTPGQYAPVAN